MAGLVKVDSKVVDKAGYFIKPEQAISVTELPRYVSRGGEKLASVAETLKLDFRGKVVLDVGSSTGGFTDYALQHGAIKVYAVDVGRGQLDYRLRTDERVVVMERTDIRNVRLRRTVATSNEQRAEEEDEIQQSVFKMIDTVPHIVVIDVSFISLRLILPYVSRLISHDSIVVAMAKPHFEADYATASKHKGVIKNQRIRRDILKQVEVFLQDHFAIAAKADSQVLGRKGNQERFYLLKPL